jgi:hypothetical protein
MVFGLRQPLFEPTIYFTQGKHTIIVIIKGQGKILNTSAKKSQNGKIILGRGVGGVKHFEKCTYF